MGLFTEKHPCRYILIFRLFTNFLCSRGKIHLIHHSTRSHTLCTSHTFHTSHTLHALRTLHTLRTMHMLRTMHTLHTVIYINIDHRDRLKKPHGIPYRRHVHGEPRAAHW